MDVRYTMSRKQLSTSNLLEILLLVATQASASPLQTVPTIACQNAAVELHVGSHVWNVDGQLQFTTRVYFHGGQPMVPGPTLLMKAGTSCTLTIVNDLTSSSPVGACNYHANTLHCPDTTNLHLHGLHISPLEDDVSVHIVPGSSHTFTYNLPSDHLMGTSWYHAHSHGSTALQMMGGLTGALIVLPADDYTLPTDLAALYATASVLVLNHVNFGGSDTHEHDAFNLFDYPAVSAAYASAPEAYESYPPNPVYFTAERSFFTANGQFAPSIPIEAGQVHLLRLVQASGLRILELELVDPNGWCQWQLIARDAVFQYTPYQQPTAIVLGPGNRADVAVKCCQAAAGQSINVKANPSSTRDASLGVQNRHTQAVVFSLAVQSSASAETSFPTSQAPLPTYLSTLLGSSLSSGARGITAIQLSSAAGEQFINLQSFPGFTAPVSQRYVERLCLGNTYEFDVIPPIGETTQSGGAHPYHQHVNHFQIVGLNSVDPAAAADVVRVGEWRDTVPAFADSGVKIRFRPNQFTGDTPLHCHISQHADLGMMGLFDISAAGSNNCLNTAGATTGIVGAGFVGGSGDEPTWTEVLIVDFGFYPETVNITVGQTVRWTTWNTGAVHTVTSGFGFVHDGLFDSPLLPAGDPVQTFVFTFTSLGSFRYYCRFHGQMTGTVNVKSSSSSAGPATTGTLPVSATTGASDGGSEPGDTAVRVRWFIPCHNLDQLMPVTLYDNEDLQFDFEPRGPPHNLLQVTEEGFNSCDASTSTTFVHEWRSVQQAGNVTVPHSALGGGVHYFICTFDGPALPTSFGGTAPGRGGHCRISMKVQVTKLSGTRPSGVPSQMPPPPPPQFVAYDASQRATVVQWKMPCLDGFFGGSFAPVTVYQGETLKIVIDEEPGGFMVHNLLEVTPDGRRTCSAVNADQLVALVAPTTQTFTKVYAPGELSVGEHGLICTAFGPAATPAFGLTEPGRGGHCGLGLSLQVNQLAEARPAPQSEQSYPRSIFQASTVNGWNTAFVNAGSPGAPLPTVSTKDSTLHGRDAIWVHSWISPSTTTALVFVLDSRISVPAGSTVAGVELNIVRKASADGVRDAAMMLVVGGVALVSSNRYPASLGPTWTTKSAGAGQKVGGVGDLWNVALTSSMINTGFGVSFSARNTKPVTIEAFVDEVAIKVYYTGGSSRVLDGAVLHDEEVTSEVATSNAAVAAATVGTVVAAIVAAVIVVVLLVRRHRASRKASSKVGGVEVPSIEGIAV